MEWTVLFFPSPSKAFGMPMIPKCLLDPVMTRQSDPTRLYQVARESIGWYLARVTNIHTDGSVLMLKGTMRTGMVC